MKNRVFLGAAIALIGGAACQTLAASDREHTTSEAYSGTHSSGPVTESAAARSRSFFASYRITFEADWTDRVRIKTFECLDADCTEARPVEVPRYRGDGIACWYEHGQLGRANDFLECMAAYETDGGSISTDDCYTISDGCSGDIYLFEQLDPDVSYGYATYFYASGDTYIPYEYRHVSFDCEFDYCVNTNARGVFFGRRTEQRTRIEREEQPFTLVRDAASGGVSQILIHPSVCSPFTWSNPEAFRAQSPRGYSDYAADTRIDMTVVEPSTGEVLFHRQRVTALPAEECVQVSGVEWVPESDLGTETLLLEIRTEVIDGQVSSTQREYASFDMSLAQ